MIGFIEKRSAGWQVVAHTLGAGSAGQLANKDARGHWGWL